jgi:hypothetical protein
LGIFGLGCFATQAKNLQPAYLSGGSFSRYIINFVKPVWYVGVQKFGPDSGPDWERYTAWARLPQLSELVSLDSILCPTLIPELIRPDWERNVQADFLILFFTDLDYLLEHLKEAPPHNLLAVMCEPELESIQAFQDERFCFQGFDLLEAPESDVSALVNCGGFDRAFDPSELNPVGLLDDFSRAKAVQHSLLEFYPGEHHAACWLWALWRMK